MDISKSHEIFCSLSGTWSFNRMIDNDSNPNRGVVRGNASFILIEQGQLFYRENGVFSTSCQKFDIYREYFYVFEKKERIAKFFSRNGTKTSLFYEMFEEKRSQNSLGFRGYHQCANDHYFAEYEFFPNGNLNEFSLRYTVAGPKKGYVLSTTYLRMDKNNE